MKNMTWICGGRSGRWPLSSVLSNGCIGCDALFSLVHKGPAIAALAGESTAHSRLEQAMESEIADLYWPANACDFG